MSVRYARGKRAYGECGRGGHRMLLKDMVRDPRTGMMVDPLWAEIPDPVPPKNITDAIALRRVTSDLDQPRIAEVFYFGDEFGFEDDTPRPLSALYEICRPTIVIGGGSFTPSYSFNDARNSGYLAQISGALPCG